MTFPPSKTMKNNIARLQVQTNLPIYINAYKVSSLFALLKCLPVLQDYCLPYQISSCKKIYPKSISKSYHQHC